MEKICNNGEKEKAKGKTEKVGSNIDVYSE